MAPEGIKAVVHCVFCNIAKGYEPATVRHENDQFIAFNDIFPKAQTHVLVIPRDHHEHLDSWLDAGGRGDDMLRFIGELTKQVGIDGRYRVLTNIGRDAGQMIPHVHWHVMCGDLPAF